MVTLRKHCQILQKIFAYGGAIRHLVDHGYTVDRIIKEFHYPISREAIEKIVNQYLDGKK